MILYLRRNLGSWIAR